ncbi:MAG: flagellar hook-length control protein FliK [Oscillibacter sp.]|nr:flagellar hook-length control protein FliK [Oscillibacter sp.]
MEMRSAFMEQVLTVSQPKQSAAKGGAKSSDSSDFGSMVQRKQQEVRGQDSRDAKPSQASDAKKPADAPDASAQGEDVPDEQYAIAAAMMMQSWLQMIPFNVAPEEQTLEVEITPTFMPDMRVEAQTEAPLEQLQAKPEEIVVQTEHRDFRQVAERVQTEVAEIADKPIVEEQTEETEETVVVEVAQAETPVFGYMEAEPVKVAPAQETPVELEAPDGMEQLRGRIEEFLTDAEGNSYVELTLSPPELGKITVSLAQTGDGALHVQLSASTARAAEILGRNTEGLQQLLASRSRPEVKIEATEVAPQPYVFVNPNADNGQEQQRRQQQGQKRRDDERDERRDVDFIHQLRLGLVGIGA